MIGWLAFWIYKLLGVPNKMDGECMENVDFCGSVFFFLNVSLCVSRFTQVTVFVADGLRY